MSDGEGTQPVLPVLRVRVLGETPIARAVVSLAAAAGYLVEPFDAGRLDGTETVVLASHGGPDEGPALRAALAAGVPYIGVVSGHARAEGVLAGLVAEGLPTEGVHTPAGLDIGARTPEEVALAILAEAVSLRPRVPGQARLARGARREDGTNRTIGGQ